MGCHAGFIAAGATVASHDANLTLIPEVPFRLDGERGFLAALERRIRERSHAVIVVAKGARQEFPGPEPRAARHASGNVKLKDVGVFLRQQIEAHFKAQSIRVSLHYFDPSYEIRSCAADSEDAIFCDLIARHAVHAAMAGKTGRSPKDKRVVKNAVSENDTWWGAVNIPLDPHTFDINRQRAQDYLNTHERLYCFDGFAGWDAKYRLKVRVICSRPSHALFMHTMLIRPTHAELDAFGAPDFVIYNAGAFPANRLTTGMGSTTSIDLSLEDKELVILGTEYAGEMKKGVFTVANYFAPKRGVLSMHCSATADKETGRSSLLFGLSGTGKTTLSADPKRHLIGDDEHCWSDDGIFNIEGGCYAKAINLTR